MKKSLLICTCFLLTACSNPSTASSSSTTTSITPSLISNNEVDVVILCGQSNAEGNTSINYLYQKASEEDNLNFLRGYKDTLIRYSVGRGNLSNDSFKPVEVGQGASKAFFGPEVGMANYLKKQNHNKKLYIIKYAIGGTCLYADWTSPNNPYDKQVGELYQGLVNFVGRSMLELTDTLSLQPTIKAICWMQGESDSHSNRETQYQKLEDSFINDLVENFAKYNPEDYTVKFIDAYISDSPNWPKYETINKAKQFNVELDSENRFVIDTIKENLDYATEPEGKPDTAHYDALSELKLGELFSKTLLDNKII